MVKDGQVMACTRMYCETPTEPKCIRYKSEMDDSQNVLKEENNVGMANPASVKCEKD
jgi:putative hemolysin